MLTVLNPKLAEYLASRCSPVEERLAKILSIVEPNRLWESMRYSVLSGGKRLRALLCLAVAEAVNPKAWERAISCACAIELAHAMSLIHDDLPALDNDDLRRGKPTNHKVFGEAIALLAGDALLGLAPQILIQEYTETLDKTILLEVVLEFLKAIGTQGMIGGQVEDIQFTGTNSSLDEVAQKLESMHQRKTGALIRFSAWSGAKIVGANQAVLDLLTEFGNVIGLAFQIADDILDVTGDVAQLGKTPGKDAESKKLTWVSVYGMDKSKAQLIALREKGLEILGSVDIATDPKQILQELLIYTIDRKN